MDSAAVHASVDALELTSSSTTHDAPAMTVEEACTRLMARFAAAGVRPEGLLSLEVFYDPERLTPSQLNARLSTALPSDARPVLTIVPLAAGALGTGEIVVQAAGTHRPAGPPTAGPSTAGRFPDLAAAGEVVVTAGQMNADPTADIAVQSQAVMERLHALLGEAGTDLDEAVRFSIHYVGGGTVEDWAEAARVRARYFTEPGPATTGIPVPALPVPGAKIMMSVLAIRGARAAGLRRHSWPSGHWDWPFHLPYKHGCECEGLAFVGGQVSLTSTADVLDPDDLGSQTRRSLDNIGKVLREIDVDLSGLQRLTAYYVHDAVAGRTADLLLSVIRGHLGSLDIPVTAVGLPTLSYPHMMVEIEAQARRRG